MTNPAAPVTALLLAGGASTRMGRDKALLDLHGTPLWQHQRDLLLAAGCRAVLVSAADTGAIPGAFADDVPGLGPLGGIASALRRLQEQVPEPVPQHLLVVPVDLPRLTLAALHTLCAAAPDAAAVYVTGHHLPARLRLDAALVAAVGACLAEPEPRRRALHVLLARLQAVAMPATPALADALTNTNSPAEWAQALARPAS